MLFHKLKKQHASVKFWHFKLNNLSTEDTFQYDGSVGFVFEDVSCTTAYATTRERENCLRHARTYANFLNVN